MWESVLNFLRGLFGGGASNVPQWLVPLFQYVLGGIGANISQNERDWLRNLISTAIAEGNRFQNLGLDILSGPVAHLGTIGGFAPQAMHEAWEAARQYPALSYYYLSNIDQNWDWLTGLGRTPWTDLALSGLFAATESLAPIIQTAAQGLAGGGWTPYFQRAYDLGFELAADPRLRALSEMGMQLAGGMGETPFTQAAQQAAIDVLGTSGSMLSPAMLAALEILATGGESPLLRALQEIALVTLMQNPLMPLSVAVGLARELAAMGAAGTVRRLMEAAQRLGGPGAVSAGIKAAPLLEAADQISQAMASAGLQALANQQQLQAGLWQRAGDMAVQAAQETARRLGLGLGFLPTAQSSMSSLINAAANLGQTGIASALSRLQTGSNLAQLPVSAGFQALNALSPIMGAQSRYALGLGETVGNLYGQMANLYNTILAGELSRLAAGINAFGAYSRALDDLLEEYGRGSTGLSQFGLGWTVAPLGTLGELGRSIWSTGFEAATRPSISAFGPLAGVPGWAQWFGSFMQSGWR